MTFLPGAKIGEGFYFFNPYFHQLTGSRYGSILEGVGGVGVGGGVSFTSISCRGARTVSVNLSGRIVAAGTSEVGVLIGCAFGATSTLSSVRLFISSSMAALLKSSILLASVVTLISRSLNLSPIFASPLELLFGITFWWSGTVIGLECAATLTGSSISLKRLSLFRFCSLSVLD